MIKRILLGAFLLITVSALVSSHSNVPRVENDSGQCSLKNSEHFVAAAPIALESFFYTKNYDVALNDAMVPDISVPPTVHAFYSGHVADGHTPIPLAMVRGPTTVKNNLTPRSRDRTIC